MKELLIGFDARLANDAYVHERWTPETRETYLLKTGVLWPLALDVSVWPSVFKNEEIDEFADDDYRLQSIGLWSNLSNMISCIRANPTLDRNYPTIIAVSVAVDQLIDRNTMWLWLLNESVVPSTLSSTWSLLGYDVADLSMISGLSNCGYELEEKAKLAATWNCWLNEYGLFTVEEPAQQFCKLTNLRVPEHNPFLVYGLYIKTGWEIG